MTTALIFAAGLLFTQSQAAATADPKLIRVYVHTDDGGESSERRDREDSVKDLAGWLGDKKKEIVRVTETGQPDIVIEVLQRWVTIPRVAMGGVSGRSGITQPPPSQIAHLRVEVTHAGKTFSFVNKNEPLVANRGWKAASDDIAKQIHKWITDRRDAIIAAR